MKLFGCSVAETHLGDVLDDNYSKCNHKVSSSLFHTPGACELGDLVRQFGRRKRKPRLSIVDSNPSTLR